MSELLNLALRTVDGSHRSNGARRVSRRKGALKSVPCVGTPVGSIVCRRYRIDCVLSDGAAAQVCLAYDMRLGRRVAIKFLRAETASEGAIARFATEIRTAARLQHPHILALIDSGEVAGVPYYVMPYIEGKALRDRIKAERQLPVCDAIDITRQVANGLDYAHRHGVVHRDIKPDNILLHEGSALIADLGIALSRARNGSVTDPGCYMGTPQYMSPEQVLGERDIDGRSDIYSLGCVLYEMLTGEPPFASTTCYYSVARSLTEMPVAPRRLRPEVSCSVEQAVLKALAKLPADRFQSAREFSRALAAQKANRQRTPRRRLELTTD